jgi:hypothetical protein
MSLTSITPGKIPSCFCTAAAVDGLIGVGVKLLIYSGSDRRGEVQAEDVGGNARSNHNILIATFIYVFCVIFSKLI